MVIPDTAVYQGTVDFPVLTPEHPDIQDFVVYPDTLDSVELVQADTRDFVDCRVILVSVPLVLVHRDFLDTRV